MSNGLSIKRAMITAMISSGFALAFSTAHAAEEYYFYVKNKSDSRIVKIQVSEKKNKGWGDFDIGKGINPGKKTKLVWDSSTNNEGCDQWIRAKFADGSMSEPSKINFCENLDDPIEFE